MVDIIKPTRIPNVDGTSNLASSVGFGVSVFKNARARQLFQVLKNVASVRDNVRNILYFRKGDYYDDPDFGVGLQDYLFDQNDEFFRLALDQEIRRQIRKYESRVRITTLQVYEPDWVDHAVVVDLVLDLSGIRLEGTASSGGTFTLQQKEAA